MKRSLYLVSVLMLGVMILLSACGASSEDLSSDVQKIPVPAANDTQCVGTMHAGYTSENGKFVEVAKQTYLLVFYTGDVFNHDGKTDYQYRYMYYDGDTTDYLPFNALRDSLSKFASTIHGNAVATGFPMLYMSSSREDNTGWEDSYYNFTASRLPESWTPDQAPINVCDPFYTDLFIPLELTASDGWTYTTDHIVFDDGNSRAELNVPSLSYFAKEHTTLARVEDGIEVGDPADVSYPVGTFRIVYGSSGAGYLRSVINAFPFYAIYQTQPDGVTFGAFGK